MKNNIMFCRSIIYFESGLSEHIIDAKVAYTSRLAYKLYKFSEEMMPETYEAINFVFSDNSNTELKNLSVSDFISVFQLYEYSSIYYLIVFILESFYNLIKC